ncbi:AraC family transcriptional regulator [soil metagenome]
MRAQFEDVHWTDDQSLLVRTFDLRRFAVPWHFHPELELTLIQEGSGDRCVGDHMGSFVAGDLVLLGPNLPHYWHSHPLSLQKRARARAIVLHWKEDSFGPGFFELQETRAWKKLLERSRRGLFYRGIAAEKLAHAMEKLVELKGARRLLATFTLINELAEAMPKAELLASEHYLPHHDQRTAGRVRKVYQFIYANLGGAITLDEVAHIAGMSPSAFSRYFKKVTGRTLMSLINELRVTQACKQLTETSHSVTEIAFASGYQSISNFNRAFQEIKSMSPMAYRQMHSV